MRHDSPTPGGGSGKPRSYSPGEVVARRVRELRDRRGWTAKELAERCAAAGMPGLNRSVIANLENGLRTRVSIDEILTLAYVLDVAPVHLLVPIEDDARLSVTPKHEVEAIDARKWIRGRRPLSGQDSRNYWTEIPDSEWSLIAREVVDFASRERSILDRLKRLQANAPGEDLERESRLALQFEQLARQFFLYDMLDSISFNDPEEQAEVLRERRGRNDPMAVSRDEMSGVLKAARARRDAMMHSRDWDWDARLKDMAEAIEMERARRRKSLEDAKRRQLEKYRSAQKPPPSESDEDDREPGMSEDEFFDMQAMEAEYESKAVATGAPPWEPDEDELLDGEAIPLPDEPPVEDDGE